MMGVQPSGQATAYAEGLETPIHYENVIRSITAEQIESLAQEAVERIMDILMIDLLPAKIIE